MKSELVIGSIYDAALADDAWDGALKNLAEYFRSQTVDLFHRDTGVAHPVFDVVGKIGFSTKDHATYAEQFAGADVRWLALLDAEPERVLADNVNFPVDELMKSAVFNEFYRPLGLGLGLGVRMLGEDGRHAVFALRRARGEPNFSPRELRAVSLTVPHLRRALQMRQRFRQAAAATDGLKAALDRLPTAMFLLDDQARVTNLNRAADRLLEVGRALSIEGRRLRAAWSSENDLLARAIADVAATAHGKIRPVPPVMMLRDRLAAPTLSILLSPIPKSAGTPIEDGAVVVAFVMDRTTATPIDVQVLARQFGFTMAEARVAAAVARGMSVEDVGFYNKTSLNTVRSQIKRAMEKAEVHSQGQLASKVLGSLAIFQ